MVCWWVPVVGDVEGDADESDGVGFGEVSGGAVELVVGHVALWCLRSGAAWSTTSRWMRVSPLGRTMLLRRQMVWRYLPSMICWWYRSRGRFIVGRLSCGGAGRGRKARGRIRVPYPPSGGRSLREHMRPRVMASWLIMEGIVRV